MPTYEYQCPEGHLFEKFQKMTDKPRAKCPVCGKPATRKISGGAGLVFKGSGFYITDYGKDGKGPRKAESDKPAAESKPESTPKADKADKAEKPDTKPAPKTEGKPSKSAPSRREGKAASE
jgi:putative FmdB family regulatory protein